MGRIKRIGILMGGCSAEREISLKSGHAVSKALKESEVDVVEIDIQTENLTEIKGLIKEAQMDVAFIALHGPFGEDGQIQSILEDMGIVYVGSGVSVSQVCMNKVKTQSHLREENILVADFIVLEKKNLSDRENILEKINLPVVVKPASQGSSFGISIVHEKSQIGFALDCAFEYDECVLVERFIKGREMTVGIIEEKALPVIEIIPLNNFFDFEAKYQKGKTKYIVPAEIDNDLRDHLQTLALKVHHTFGCEDISRIDFIVDENNVPYVLEINTIPGFTETSLVPMAAQSIGISFTDLCLLLVRKAHGKKEKGKSTISASY